MKTEMVYVILYTLLQRHERAAEYYNKASDLAKSDDLAGLLKSLAAYREDLGQQVRRFLENTSPAPMPNKNTEGLMPLIEKRWPELEEALADNKRLEVISLCHETEQALSDYYRESLGQGKQTAAGIQDLLQQQHNKILEVTRQTERLETVPQQRNIEIDI